MENCKNSQEYKAGRAAAEWWQTLSEEQRKQMDIVDAFAYGVLHGWNNPNWISVEEELPPKGMEVIAWGITKPVEKGKLAFRDVFYSWRLEHKPLFYDAVDENGFYLYGIGSRSDHRGYKVTHWMPIVLPQGKEDKQ